jgi:hypothetical protein
MLVIDRTCGQEVVIGPYTLRVLDIQADQVVVALICRDEDETPGGDPCGHTPASVEPFISPGAQSGHNGRKPPP